MTEEVNKNVHLLKSLRNAIIHMEDDDKIKQYINEMNLEEYPKEGAYAQCIDYLKRNINDFNHQDKTNLVIAIEICDYYLKFAKGEIYNPIKYKTDFRKEKYKQLNLDMPKEIMEKFDYYLKQNNHTKKSVIQKAIQDYITENEKTKKSS